MERRVDRGGARVQVEGAVGQVADHFIFVSNAPIECFQRLKFLHVKRGKAVALHRADITARALDPKNLDVCAPGSMLLASNAPDPAASIIGPVPGSLGTSDYKAGRGTSFAVGFTAGIAALVRAQHPDWPGKGVEPQQIPGLIEARLEDAVSTTEVTLPQRAGTRPRVNAKGAVVVGPKAPMPGDINVDGCVDAADLGLLLAAWQQPLDATTLNLVDLDGSAEVGPADLGLLLSLWSNDCP